MNLPPCVLYETSPEFLLVEPPKVLRPSTTELIDGISGIFSSMEGSRAMYPCLDGSNYPFSMFLRDLAVLSNRRNSSIFIVGFELRIRSSTLRFSACNYSFAVAL